MGRWLALGVLLALASGCGKPAPFVKASRIESNDQTIGGPVGYGRTGDFLLENGQMRAIIEQGGRSKLPLDVGGSLIDVDLVRPEEQYRQGHGLDQLGQISPVANLYQARALSPSAVRITSPGEGVAEVTASAEAAGIQKILEALGLLVARDFAGPVDYSKFRLYTEYRLLPDKRVLTIRTTVGFDVPFCPAKPEDQCGAACDDAVYDADCTCPQLPARCREGTAISATPIPDRPTAMGISDILLGDLPRPVGTGTCLQDQDCDTAAGEDCADLTTALGGTSRVCRGPAARDPGVFFGDMLLFGGHLSPFVEGIGFDTESDIRRLFDSGVDTLSNPLQLDAVFAIGDQVSYGYSAPTGKLLVPVFGGPFSLGVTGASSCRHDDPGCLAGKVMRSERWFSVGTGDATSAAEPLAQERGLALGEVVGTVRRQHSPNAASGVEVYALADPRDLPCDAACLARCGEVDTFLELDPLIAANKCRTLDSTYLKGVAGVATMARADPGTDPVKDGDFRLALAPGRYYLVAQDAPRARSQLAGVEVSADQRTTTALVLPEPGRLQWNVKDDRGQFVAARLIVGRCFPGAACGSDAQCLAGEHCRAGACACERAPAWPLELGGERLEDGAIAFDVTDDGHGVLALMPGDYDVLVSHGPGFSTFARRVTVVANQATLVNATVVRTVRHDGWAAADFHVHAEQSLDSGLDMAKRVKSFLAEEVDFLSSSDHDVLSRYAPIIEELGVRPRVGSQVGVETTTQDLGHFIGYPLNYVEYTADAPPERVRSNGAPEWREKTPQEIFDAIRAAGDPSGPMLVEVPHPYTYFDFYGVDPKTLEPTDSIVSLLNPLVLPKNFSGDFEAMELMNSKGADQIRRPTVDEVRFYSQGLDETLALRNAGAIDEAEYSRRNYELSTEATRRFLHRTPAEQHAAITGEGSELGCRCGSDGDCSGGKTCDQTTMTCGGGADGGTPAPGDGMCRALRGVVDDWFVMLNRGVRRTGVGGSDAHSLFSFDSTGTPRVMLKTGATTGANLTQTEVVQAVLAGQVFVTNGPMVTFTVNGKDIGDTAVAQAGEAVSVHVKVETPGWFDVDRVELYRNGELIHWVGGCASRRPGDGPDGHEHGCIATPQPTTTALDATFEDLPGLDAWYVAIALGLDGRSLAPVYASSSLARFGTFEIAQRIYDIVPALSGLRTPRFPSLYPAFPVAITNPVWVDLGGDGWTAPNGPPPSWCTKGRDVGCDDP